MIQMGLTIKTINVDSDVWDSLQKTGINLSETIRDFLLKLSGSKNNDLEGFDAQLNRIELSKNIAEMTKIQAKIQNLQQNLNIFDQKQQEIQENKLKKEREELEKSKRCPDCNGIIDGKGVNVKEGVILCYACGSDKEHLRQYLAKKQDISQEKGDVFEQNG
jgi:formylmethanofuran dehydrogenase subunit E